MREIKFRAWDKNRKRIRKVWQIDYKAGENFIMVQMPDSQFMPNSCDWGNTKEHIILMQYTGLKDKDGKEIYEGDILIHLKYNKVAAVEWVQNSTGFFLYTWTLTRMCEPNIKVIGNIYETPELLEAIK